MILRWALDAPNSKTCIFQASRLGIELLEFIPMTNTKAWQARISGPSLRVAALAEAGGMTRELAKASGRITQRGLKVRAARNIKKTSQRRSGMSLTTFLTSMIRLSAQKGRKRMRLKELTIKLTSR